MTVENQLPIQHFTANGTATVFAINFAVEGKHNVKVKVNGTDASVNDFSYDTLTNAVVFNTAPSNGSEIIVERETTIDRAVNYQTYDNSFRPEVLNEDLDRIVRILQELNYTDSIIIKDLAEEIYIRTQQVADINEALDLHGITLEVIQEKQLQETMNRINGDNEVALSAREYTDFMLRMNNTNPSIFSGITDNIVITQTGETQKRINQKTLKNGEYPKVLGSPVLLKLDTSKASLLYGISDPTHLDDNLNNFRGLNSKNAWDDANIPIGGVAFGRNNVPFAYLSTALGHDCVAYGVASVTGGAGSATGNPDVPSDGANFGYCSLAVGKDTVAKGRISNAMGQECVSESRFTSTDGYKCFAGRALPTHPDYGTGEGEEGAAARAHGYESKAYGNFAFAYGSFLTAYNGCQLIGKGMNSSKRGVGIGYGVDRPTIFAKEGDGRFGWVGFNTDVPLSKYDFRLHTSDTVSYTIDQQASPDTLMAMEVKGLLGDGTYGSLHNIVVTHPNAGQPFGLVQYRINGTEYLTVDQTKKASFNGAVEAGGAGFVVAGKRVVGGQLEAISELPSTATLEEVLTKVNSVLYSLRAHGLIAT